MAKKHTGSPSRSNTDKLDAALAQAEQLIRAVRTLIRQMPDLPVGPGGGRPCSSLINAEGRIRKAELGLIGPKPSGGGGTPCSSLSKATGNIRDAELGLSGPRPCPPRQ
jgi:hypothetical protein